MPPGSERRRSPWPACSLPKSGGWRSPARPRHVRLAGLPFGAFAPMLPPDADGDDQGREDHGALLRRYARALVERAKGRRLVVFVDDAHLLDNGSATLFHQLALTQAATVLATVRSDELAPDAVVDLWKDGPAERIEVDVLKDAVIEELLVTVLAGPVDAAAMRQLTGRSRGNPMFLRELVTGALESGTLVDEGGIWRLRGALRPTARPGRAGGTTPGRADRSRAYRVGVAHIGRAARPGDAGSAHRCRLGRGLRGQGSYQKPHRGPPHPGVARPSHLRGRSAGRDHRASPASSRPVAGRSDRGDRGPSP